MIWVLNLYVIYAQNGTINVLLPFTDLLHDTQPYVMCPTSFSSHLHLWSWDVSTTFISFIYSTLIYTLVIILGRLRIEFKRLWDLEILTLRCQHSQQTILTQQILWYQSSMMMEATGPTMNLVFRGCVKCGKFMEGTPGTPDVKSGPTRCQKGLRLQLMCCTPFRLLSQDFGTGRSEIGDQKIGVSIGVVLRVETRGQVIEVRTYSIFELKYLHDMSEVFMLSIRINKKINQKTRNKQNP